MFVSRLRIERTKRGVTQVALFLRTGIPQWRISLLERGIQPRAEERKKIADALGLDEQSIFEKNYGSY